MEDIKKINPVLLSIISIIVFAISFLGAPYIFAQTSSIYYCKSKIDTTANPDIRYFACSTNSSFTNSQVSESNAATFCEMSPELPWCEQVSVSTMIKNSLGNYYCSGGWAYSPSSGTPSSNFSCSTPPPPQGAFDFSLSKPGDKSVVQGSSVSNTITTTLTAGTPTPVTFSVSGLPPNSSASFSPVSCTPTSSGAKTCTPTPTINILTTALTPPGTYPVIIVGTSEAVNLGFPNQTVTALGSCPGGPTGDALFSGTIYINNQNPYLAKFSRIEASFNPIDTELAPEDFEIPANTILAKAGFGAISFPNCPAVPPEPYGQVGSGEPPTGTITYSVNVNGIVSEVTYSWDYAI